MYPSSNIDVINNLLAPGGFYDQAINQLKSGAAPSPLYSQLPGRSQSSMMSPSGWDAVMTNIGVGAGLNLLQNLASGQLLQRPLTTLGTTALNAAGQIIGNAIAGPVGGAVGGTMLPSFPKLFGK